MSFRPSIVVHDQKDSQSSKISMTSDPDTVSNERSTKDKSESADEEHVGAFESASKRS